MYFCFYLGSGIYNEFSVSPPTISINGGAAQNFNTFIGDKLGVYNLPDDTDPSVNIRIVNTAPNTNFMVNIFQVQSNQQYVVAFTDKLTNDAEYPYLSYTGYLFCLQ